MADNKPVPASDSVSLQSRRCSYCGQQASLVWVHGHGQCANCGINVQECCQGETCKTDKRNANRKD